MAAEIEAKTGLKANVLKGRTGSFEIKLGNQVLFSKLAQNRFPKKGEVVSALTQAMHKKEK